MGEVARNFITQFHSLLGETVKEKHQNLFQLLHQHLSLKQSPEELEFITANLNPTTHLEKIFRVDFLIYFRRFNELYEDFKKGDEITASKISKHDWFFQSAFKEIGCEEFVNSFLPATSYSLKLKILKKLPVGEQQADEFFDALRKRYGIFLATILIPKCTIRKIRKAFTTFPIKLTVSQLQAIFKRDPDLIYVYLEERTKHEGSSTFMNHNPIFKYIAQKNPEVFSNLYKKYHFETGLGRRTTKKYISLQKSSVLDEAEAYIKILNKSKTVRMVGSEIRALLQEPGQSGSHWREILKYYPRNQRFNIYRSTYDSFYHYKFGENIDAISEDILEIISDPNERERLAKLKIEKEDKEDYLKYCTPDYCLKQLTEKLNHSTTTERAKYIEIATFCCILNKDVQAFLKVCELVNVRFKNDDRTIRQSLFTTLMIRQDDKFFEKFDAQLWKVINELMITSRAKGGWIYSENVLVIKYVKHLMENNENIEELLGKEFNWYETLFCYGKVESKVLKAIINKFIEIGHTLEGCVKHGAERFDCSLANACKVYNERNPNDVLDVSNHPRIIKSVKEMLNDEDPSWVPSECMSGIEYMVCQTSSSEELHELKKLYFKAFNNFGNISGLMWFLKHEPRVLQDNFDQFLSNFLEARGINTRKLWRFIKKCHHLDLDRRTVEFCKQKLGEEGYKSKANLIRPLSILSPSDSYLDLIRSYLPVSEKVDLTDDDVKELYLIQEKFVRFLHLMKSPEEILPTTLEFCKGDYLQFALSPLYSCMYKLPENETKLFISKLDEIKAVSVKKHAMNLSCVIYDVDTVFNCLKQATVPALMPTLRYFVKNPSEALWKVVESQINTLEKNELQTLKEALDLNVPFEYKSRYVETIWRVLDRHANKEFKKILVTKIDKKTIQNLDSDFAFNIIQSSLFKIEEANELVANLLIYLNDNEKFTVLSNILSDLKTNFWDQQETRRITRRKLDRFILSLFGAYMEATEPDKKFVSKLVTLFDSIFSVSETFEESIVVRCMAFKDETPETCAKLLVHLNNIFVEKYGKFALNLFADAISNRVFMHVFTSDDDRIKLCHSLLKVKESVDDYLLIIKLLPKNEPKDEEHFLLYNDILIHLTEVTEVVVQLQFSLFLKSGLNAKSNQH